MFGILASVINQATVIPISEVDQLFYGEIQKISEEKSGSLLSDKIELCDHVKENYLSLKPQMILELDRVCADQVLKISQRSKTELSQAFNWAYSEYARRPQPVQIMALACLYAETNQKEFAVQLAEKHKFANLQGALKTSGRCPAFSSRRIASVEGKD